MTPKPIVRSRLGDLESKVEQQRRALAASRAVRRVWERDHTLWSDSPTEITDRLGWLDVPAEILGAVDEVNSFVAGCRGDGLKDVVVMGMGGSRLFPEVLARSFDAGDVDDDGDTGLKIHVLDSTDPEAVGHIAAQLDPSTTLYLAASKSGTTIETRSHLDFFWARVNRGENFAAITDPGSELASLARERQFRWVFENRSDIGGRYSALSYFGLVPAALAGIHWTEMVSRAVHRRDEFMSDDPTINAALELGAILAAAVLAGRDKITILADPKIDSFGLWLEQLLAESTGKNSTGVIPIVDEPLGPIDVYGDDRVFVTIGDSGHGAGLEALADSGHPVIEMSITDPLDLGTQVLLWELATALCGAALRINPFDQPNVAEAKAATNSVLESSDRQPLPQASLDEVLGTLKRGDYIAVQIYADPRSAQVERLQELRLELRDRHRVATTFGIGPRFLHSTGQLHKGGPPTGVFIQVVSDDGIDAHIPSQPFGFSQLKWAQADGDLLTLHRHGLRVARTSISEIENHLASAVH